MKIQISTPLGEVSRVFNILQSDSALTRFAGTAPATEDRSHQTKGFQVNVRFDDASEEDAWAAPGTAKEWKQLYLRHAGFLPAVAPGLHAVVGSAISAKTSYLRTIHALVDTPNSRAAIIRYAERTVLGAAWGGRTQEWDFVSFLRSFLDEVDQEGALIVDSLRGINGVQGLGATAPGGFNLGILDVLFSLSELAASFNKHVIASVYIPVLSGGNDAEYMRRVATEVAGSVHTVSFLPEAGVVEFSTATFYADATDSNVWGVEVPHGTVDYNGTGLVASCVDRLRPFKRITWERNEQPSLPPIGVADINETRSGPLSVAAPADVVEQVFGAKAIASLRNVRI